MQFVNQYFLLLDLQLTECYLRWKLPPDFSSLGVDWSN